jgi:hypothetical protein
MIRPITAKTEGTVIAGFVHHRPFSDDLISFAPLGPPADAWEPPSWGRESVSGPSLIGLVSALARRITAISLAAKGEIRAGLGAASSMFKVTAWGRQDLVTPFPVEHTGARFCHRPISHLPLTL